MRMVSIQTEVGPATRSGRFKGMENREQRTEPDGVLVGEKTRMGWEQ